MNWVSLESLLTELHYFSAFAKSPAGSHTHTHGRAAVCVWRQGPGRLAGHDGRARLPAAVRADQGLLGDRVGGQAPLRRARLGGWAHSALVHTTFRLISSPQRTQPTFRLKQGGHLPCCERGTRVPVLVEAHDSY